ncbi:MAG: hypothetical protein JO129_01630 [Candidatus Dependentiae bacterium]|nr:hypothetical protein [Candidatus Dependentiae bacterium]
MKKLIIIASLNLLLFNSTIESSFNSTIKTGVRLLSTTAKKTPKSIDPQTRAAKLSHLDNKLNELKHHPHFPKVKKAANNGDLESVQRFLQENSPVVKRTRIN